MSDPKRRFYPAGDDPVTVDFASTDGMSESFTVEAKGFATDNPVWIGEAEKFVALGVLSDEKPVKETK